MISIISPQTRVYYRSVSGWKAGLEDWTIDNGVHFVILAAGWRLNCGLFSPRQVFFDSATSYLHILSIMTNTDHQTTGPIVSRPSGNGLSRLRIREAGFYRFRQHWFGCTVSSRESRTHSRPCWDRRRSCTKTCFFLFCRATRRPRRSFNWPWCSRKRSSLPSAVAPSISWRANRS